MIEGMGQIMNSAVAYVIASVSWCAEQEVMDVSCNHDIPSRMRRIFAPSMSSATRAMPTNPYDGTARPRAEGHDRGG